MDKQYKLVPTEILDRFPELNMSNYDSDDVEALNAWGIELVLAAASQPSPAEPLDREAIRNETLEGVAALIGGQLWGGASEHVSALIAKHVRLLKSQPAQPIDDKWRDLALQFDGHRMQAIGWLKAAAQRLPEHIAAPIKAFLNEPPLTAEKVLADRIASMRQPSDSQAEVSDTTLIDWLDDNAKRFNFGFHIGLAPVGNIGIQTVGNLKTDFRTAIKAAMKDEKEKE